jgi:hypothetical protein
MTMVQPLAALRRMRLPVISSGRSEPRNLCRRTENVTGVAMPYPTLRAYVEESAGLDEIVALGFDEPLVVFFPPVYRLLSTISH